MAAGSSGMETLVENVDRSGVVLVFLSNRLKNSAACRSGTVYLSLVIPHIMMRSVTVISIFICVYLLYF